MSGEHPYETDLKNIVAAFQPLLIIKYENNPDNDHVIIWVP